MVCPVFCFVLCPVLCSRLVVSVFGYMCLIGSSRWEEGVLGGDLGRGRDRAGLVHLHEARHEASADPPSAT